MDGKEWFSGCLQKVLKELAMRLEASTQLAIHQEIPCCRITKIFRPENVKLWTAITDNEVRNAYVSSVEQIGGRVLVGAAPPGVMEAEMAKWLENIHEKI